MPAFLVELPASGGQTRIGAADSMVVFATDAANARAVAANHFDGDSNVLWNDAATTVTEILAGSVLPANYELEIKVLNDGAGAGIAIPAVFKAVGGSGNLAIASATVGAAPGATYADDDIEVLAGGTFTRAATVRVTGETGGAVDTVEIVDPGEYTVLPTLDEIVTSGNGDGNLTVDGVAAAEDSYEVILGQIITLLNADPEIDNAAVDLSEGAAGARLLTIASIADDIGDSTVTIRFGAPLAGNVPELTSTIVDEGVAAAVLTMVIPAVSALINPTVLRALKS